jgi:hypothetical protein
MMSSIDGLYPVPGTRYPHSNNTTTTTTTTTGDEVKNIDPNQYIEFGVHLLKIKQYGTY